MKRISRIVLVLALSLLAIGPPASADTLTVVGSIQDAFVGPATGATVTLCEYGALTSGFVETQVVPEDGFISIVIPYLPATVAFEVEGDPAFEDVHVVVAQTICPVSPCNPNQSAAFEIRLQRRVKQAWPLKRLRVFPPAL